MRHCNSKVAPDVRNKPGNTIITLLQRLADVLKSIAAAAGASERRRDDGSLASLRAARTIAGTLAIVSRQPILPQLQRMPLSATTT
jgi:hypothetical protein